MKLSAIIITRNEGENILGCLSSIAFVDEIIVLDYGSVDRTVELARSFGAYVEQVRDWPGFGLQKNRALDLATGDWVLSIDADERVTESLADEIRITLHNPEHFSYEINRLSSFCGRFIKHSGWHPDYVLRLFHRKSARFSNDTIHEKLIACGNTGRLRGRLLHFPYANIDVLLRKINRYSSDAATMMHDAGHTSSVAKALAHSIWTFIRTYFIRRGFLDGRHGFILATGAATSSFYRYTKLMFLSKNRDV